MRYITNQQFHKDIHKLCQIINEKYPDLVGVAGVPRSGMFAASYIAMMSGVPLYEASERKGRLVPIGCGFRIKDHEYPIGGTIVVIDDSANSGRAMNSVREALGNDYKYAVVYSTQKMADKLDVYAEIIEDLHFFQWHLFGSQLLTRYKTQQGRGFILDFDGVFCEDCPPDCDDDGERYLDFLHNARPLIFPKPFYVHSIATARLNKYREETEAWLRKYGIKWGHLYMGKWKTLQERRLNYNAGEYKGQIYLDSGCAVFIESCPIQARQIFEFTKKPVICNTSGEVYDMKLCVEQLKEMK